MSMSAGWHSGSQMIPSMMTVYAGIVANGRDCDSEEREVRQAPRPRDWAGRSIVTPREAAGCR